MKFIYSTFIENSPEMREWLEKIGYDISKVRSDKPYLIVDKGIAFSMGGGFVEALKDREGYIDCLGNPELFKAVTALRHDSDYMQWFVIDEDVYDKDFNENVLKIYSEGQFILCYNSKIYSSLAHKATLTELQKRFKK